MHHDLLKNAEVMSKRTFIVNGVWIFMLTLVPFNTAWVGSSPNALLPEFIYPLNMLLWSASFQWLDYQIMKDNPGKVNKELTKFRYSLIIYGGHVICMALAFVKPILSMYVVGFLTFVMLIWTFVGHKKAG